MTVKTLTHPTTGRTVKLGRNLPHIIHPTLKFRDYLGLAPVPVPDTVDWYRKHAGLWNSLGNDQLGDCLCAAAGHIEDVFRKDSENGLPPITQGQAINLYVAACGYVRGDTYTDNGGTLQEVLAYWRSKGILGGGVAAIAGYVAVEATKATEVEQAVYLFGNLYIGLSLPDEWISPFPATSGFVWDVAGKPDPDNGHCVAVFGYNSQGVFIDSWGLNGTITWAAFAKYLSTDAGGEVYAVLSQDWIEKATALAPSGFNFAALQADLKAL
jgi:hypothetical protein